MLQEYPYTVRSDKPVAIKVNPIAILARFPPLKAKIIIPIITGIAHICWVRNASFADSSVGNDNASSRLFVCNDCAPPRIAERA